MPPFRICAAIMVRVDNAAAASSDPGLLCAPPGPRASAQRPRRDRAASTGGPRRSAELPLAPGRVPRLLPRGEADRPSPGSPSVAVTAHDRAAVARASARTWPVAPQTVTAQPSAGAQAATRPDIGAEGFHPASRVCRTRSRHPVKRTSLPPDRAPAFFRPGVRRLLAPGSYPRLGTTKGHGRWPARAFRIRPR